MLNLNKVFPRLSIRNKLAIGFTAVALVPLGAVTAVGVRDTVAIIRDAARSTLQRDLEFAESQTAGVLHSAEAHVEYFARDLVPRLTVNRTPDARTLQDLGVEISRQIAVEPSLSRVHIYTADGECLLAIDDNGPRAIPGDEGAAPYYAFRAQEQAPGTRLILPVELRDGTDANGRPGTVAALAIVRPVHDAQGSLAAIVVGEALATEVFRTLETASDGYAGVTGLVDSSGLFLYHSTRKREWGRLLAVRQNVTLRSDYTPAAVSRVLSGETGSVETDDGRMISFRPFQLSGRQPGELTLYRAVPLGQLQAPVRAFMLRVAGLGAAAAALVLIAAVLGANQFTRPIIKMREATRNIADHDEPVAITADTNDELEDLAIDLTRLSELIADQRVALHRLVSEQGRDLAHTRAALADVVDHSADAIILTDADGMVLAWNQGATRLFEYDAEEAIGQPIELLIGRSGPGIERELAYFTRELALHGEVVNYETERATKRGALVPVSLTLTRVQATEGAERTHSLIVRDRRMQKQLDEQLRRSERLASISVLAAGLAHEINTPLAIVANRLELMERELDRSPQSDTLRADLGVVSDHVSRLANVTGGLLRFAREDDSGEGPIDVVPMIRRIAGLLERTIVQRRLRLDVSVPDNLPMVHANAMAIETVIVNLLVNAADATPPGGSIRLAASPLADTSGVQISVADTGPGVPLALRQQIFDPFFTTKPPGRGTGLGLTVCRSIVERHGGELVLDSPPGAGARFHFTLHRDPSRLSWSTRAS